MDAIPPSRSESLSWAFAFGWGPLHHPLNTLSTEFLFGIFMSPLVCDHRHHVVGHVVRPSGRMDKGLLWFRRRGCIGPCNGIYSGCVITDACVESLFRLFIWDVYCPRLDVAVIGRDRLIDCSSSSTDSINVPSGLIFCLFVAYLYYMEYFVKKIEYKIIWSRCGRSEISLYYFYSSAIRAVGYSGGRAVRNSALTKKLTDEFCLFFTDITYIPYILWAPSHKRPLSKMAD